MMCHCTKTVASPLWRHTRISLRKTNSLICSQNYLGIALMVWLSVISWGHFSLEQLFKRNYSRILFNLTYMLCVRKTSDGCTTWSKRLGKEFDSLSYPIINISGTEGGWVHFRGLQFLFLLGHLNAHKIMHTASIRQGGDWRQKLCQCPESSEMPSKRARRRKSPP